MKRKIVGLLFIFMTVFVFGGNYPSITIDVNSKVNLADLELKVENTEIKEVLLSNAIVEPKTELDITIKGDNIISKKYKIIKSESKPNFPSNGFEDLNIDFSTVIESDVMSDKKGYLTTRKYNYAGIYNETIGKVSVTRKAEEGTTYSETDGDTLFFPDQKIVNTLAQQKAMKVWGYIQVDTSGEYVFSALSDDGVYGYITINGEKKEFVNDWTIAAAFYRGIGKNGNNVNNPNDAIVKFNLDKNKKYPIYMEWFEGHITNGAFSLYYKNGNKWDKVKSNWFYPSKNTIPGEVSDAYFNVGSDRVNLPLESGDYYIALQVTNRVNNNDYTSKILYGPFTIPNPSIADKKQTIVVDLSKFENNLHDVYIIEDDNDLTFQAMKSVKGYSKESFNYTKISDFITIDKKWFYQSENLGDYLFINKSNKEGIEGETNVSKFSLVDELGNNLGTIYYPLKLNNINLNRNSDLLNVTWKKVEANKYGKYFNNQKIMFRLYRNNETEYKYDIYNKTYNKNLLSESNYQDFIDGKIDYVDIEFNYYTYNKKLEYGTMTFIYSPENVTIQGLPINEEFMLEIYTEYSDENGNYDVYNLEHRESFLSGKPAIDDDNNAKLNNIYMINSIDKSAYPLIDVDFFTKAPKELNITADNILSTTDGAIGYIKEKREDQEKTTKVSYVGKSDKMGLKYPLDVIIMLDGSASMNQEINAVRESLGDIVSILESNGFDVKFNLISFEAPQDAWLLNGADSDTNRIKFVPETDTGKDDFKVEKMSDDGAHRYDQFDYTDSSWDTYRSSHIVDVPSPAKKRNYGEVYFTQLDGNNNNLGIDNDNKAYWVQEKDDKNNKYKILKNKNFKKTSGRMVRDGEYYLTVYKGNDEGTGDGWFDDLSIVQQAIKQVGANGIRGSSIYWDGVSGKQGNGAWALHYAIKRFEDYGRGLDKYGNITSNKNDIVLKSKKWIIMPTDEGLDAGPRINKLGYTKDDVIKKLSEKMKNNNIYFSLIANDKSSSSVRPYTDFKKQDGLDISWHDIEIEKDNGKKRPVTKEELKSYLIEDAKKLGIIQRWSLKYNTPFNDYAYEEGKSRKVYFNLNLTLDTGSDAVLTKQLDDVTEDSNRTYIEPTAKTLELHITSPNENASNRIFNLENNLIKIKGWTKDKYVELSRIWIEVKNKSGEVVYLDKDTYSNIQDSSLDTQYPFTFNIDESKLNKGEIYDLYVYVENRNGLREQRILEDILFMPELNEVIITNTTNKELFEELKIFNDNEIKKYTSVTSNSSDITDDFYMNNGNIGELKITLDADTITTINENPFGLVLSGLDKITFVKSIKNDNGTVDLIYNIEITDDTEEEKYITGKIYNNEIVKIKVIKNKNDSVKYGDISQYKKGTTILEPIEEEYYLNDAGSISVIGGNTDTIGYIALYNYDQSESDLTETKTNILSSKDIDLSNNIYWNATNSNELGISTDKIEDSNSLDGKYTIKKIVTISKTGKIANKIITANDFKNKLLEEYNDDTEGVLNSVYYMDTIAPVITDFTIEKTTNTEFTDFKIGDKFNVNLIAKDNKLSFEKENYILTTNPDLEVALDYEQNKTDFKDNITEITENTKIIEQFEITQEKELTKELIGKQDIEFDVEVVDKAGNSAKASDNNLNQTITYNNETIESLEVILTSDVENVSNTESTPFIKGIMDKEFKIIKDKVYFTVNGKNSNGDSVDLAKTVITVNNKNYTITNFVNEGIVLDNGMNSISKITLYSTSGYEKIFTTSDSITVDSKASTLGNLKILKDNKFDSNPVNNFKVYIDYKSGTNYTVILDAGNMKDYTKLWKIVIKEVRIKGVKVTDLKYTDEGVEKTLGENTTFEYTVDTNDYEAYKTKIKNNELLDGEVKVIGLNISNHKEVAGGRITFKLDIVDNLSNSFGSGFQIEGFVPKADFEIIGKTEESSRSRTSKVKIVGDSQNDFEVQSVNE